MGGAAGYLNSTRDQVSEIWVTRNIADPKLTGYTHYHREDTHTETYYTTETHYETDSDGNTVSRTEEVPHHYEVHDGWYHRYSPDIRWDKVGEYQEPTLQHSRSVGFVGGRSWEWGSGR